MEQEKQAEKIGGKCALYTILFGASLVVWLWYSGKQHRESLPPAQQCLSAWDGSHPGMVRATKELMNDPGSFEHVETRYIDRGNEIDLIMKFRGKNKVGGVVTNTATGTISNDCDLISGPSIL